MSDVTVSTALARVLVDELARHGLEHLCLAPGSRSAPLAMAADEHPQVRVHVGIDERSCAFLALGLARGARRPAAVVTTSGTAAANLLPGVVEAHEARVPLIALTADRPQELRATGANQTIDQVKLFGDHTRWFVEVGPAENRDGQVAHWRSVASRLWAAATGGPPGPVHCNVAFREPLVDDPASPGFPEPLDGRPDGRPWTQTMAGRARPTDAELERLVSEVAAIERGLLVVGDTTANPGALVAMAEAAGWPVLAEPLSGARRGSHAISTYGALLADDRFAAAHRPDFVVRVGRPALSRALLTMLDQDVTQVLIDPDAAWLDPHRAISRVIAADPSALASSVAKLLPGRPRSPWLDSWRRAEQHARDAIDAVLDAHPRLTEARLARDLAAAVPTGGTLIVASSLPVRDLDAWMRPRSGLRVLGNRGASGIDGFVSTALGVALSGTGPAVALSGDLSLLHDQNGFLLAGCGQVDLPIVVVNNDGGGIFSFLPQSGFPDQLQRLFTTPHGVDFAHVARVYGLGHVLIEGADELADAVSGRGLRLVEVRTDRDENVALQRQLRDAVSRALD